MGIEENNESCDNTMCLLIYRTAPIPGICIGIGPIVTSVFWWYRNWSSMLYKCQLCSLCNIIHEIVFFQNHQAKTTKINLILITHSVVLHVWVSVLVLVNTFNSNTWYLKYR